MLAAKTNGGVDAMLRGSNEVDSAPLLAASIFLDILNVFQFFLSLFGRSRR